MSITLYLGLDVHKDSITIAIAEPGSKGELRLALYSDRTWHQLNAAATAFNSDRRDLLLIYIIFPAIRKLPIALIPSDFQVHASTLPYSDAPSKVTQF